MSRTVPPGRFIAVVGPSGAGKDSVMEAYCAAHPDVILVGPWQARLDMQAAEGWDEALEARIQALPFIASPPDLVLAAARHADALRARTVHIPPAGGPGPAGNPDRSLQHI